MADRDTQIERAREALQEKQEEDRARAERERQGDDRPEGPAEDRPQAADKPNE